MDEVASFIWHTYTLMVNVFIVKSWIKIEISIRYELTIYSLTAEVVYRYRLVQNFGGLLTYNLQFDS